MSNYECLKLENQLCFPIYVCSKEIIRKYKPYLDKLDLTYTQYLAMMVMWDLKKTNVKELGLRLYLDSGTLTPVLKKLEVKGYITRSRSFWDERNLIVQLTEAGQALEEKAKDIPTEMCKCLGIKQEEMENLYNLMYKILKNLS